jgi:hypothetical protein
MFSDTSGLTTATPCTTTEDICHHYRHQKTAPFGPTQNADLFLRIHHHCLSIGSQTRTNCKTGHHYTVALHTVLDTATAVSRDTALLTQVPSSNLG